MAFWDTSAVVPLCCDQEATNRSRVLLRETGAMTVWWGSLVEARSAIARLRLDGFLTVSGRESAVASLRLLLTSWSEVQPTSNLRELAAAIPDRFGLRALDALQLAAALAWCQERPQGRGFVCYDERLAQAAADAGFTVFGQFRQRD